VAFKRTEGNTALLEKHPYVITIDPIDKPQDLKVRVAAYARVSTSSEDQHNSFEAQVNYYTTLIAGKENWILADVYADEGVTGTSAEKRKDFQRLLTDCRKGLIDKILVKSISRFARNTKECLETIRELKSLGIGIRFEKENIDTSQMSGELMTAVFASFAQAESESISSNMRWSYQKRMQDGSFNTCRAPYGYRLEKGRLIIQEEEAQIIRHIFSAYLNGNSTYEIAAELMEYKHSERKWNKKTIEYILQNERYAGNALLQKRYMTETLPRKMVYNRGEKEMYFIQGSNEAIISEEIFEQAQKLRETRREKIMVEVHPRLFSKVMLCGNCGKMLRPKPVRGKIYMVCRIHEQSLRVCPLPPIPERQIQQAFLRLHYKLNHHREILEEMIGGLQEVHNRRMLWNPNVVELNKQISELFSQNQMLASLKQQGLIDPDFFISQSNQLAQQLRILKQKKDSLTGVDKDETIEKTQDILDVLEAGPDFLDSFDKEIFSDLIENIVAEDGETLKFQLKNGLILTETIERTLR